MLLEGAANDRTEQDWCGVQQGRAGSIGGMSMQSFRKEVRKEEACCEEKKCEARKSCLKN